MDGVDVWSSELLLFEDSPHMLIPVLPFSSESSEA